MFNLVPFRFDDFDKNFWPDFFNDDLMTNRLTGFRTDVIEGDSDYRIEAELPGFAKEDIQVELDDNRLTISAVQNEERENGNGKFLRRERRTGRVMRSFILDNVDNDSIRAEFRDGVLKLTLPKKHKEEPRTRKIDIQ